ncbi:MAG TPA: ATP-binding protein, partial [Methanofastidiosum sp.]|nr:ATP-binding protein [Methanofastidiosum sp.]
FNFEATNDKYLEETHIVEVAPNTRILKLGIIYGANASGKSNLINAFEYLHDFWFNTTENKDEETGVIPFLLDDFSKNEPTEFGITFFINSKKYIYNLKLNKNIVFEEKLSYYPTIKPLEILSRHLNQNISEIRFNRRIKITSAIKDEIAAKCLVNMSVFAAYNKVNVSIPEIDAVISWMKVQFLQSLTPNIAIQNYTEGLLLKDPSIKDYIVNFLSKADFNISNIITKIEDKKLSDELISYVLTGDIPTEEKERLRKDKTIQITKSFYTHRIQNKNGEFTEYELPGDLQSEGTIRTLGIAGVLKRAIEKDAFVAIDEIESSLHPRLVEFVIEYFLRNSQQAQLLITTHYDGLLEEEDLLRNDNIWFTSKKDSGSTEIYSLADFKGINRISSLQKAYKYGKFGAVPNI